MGMGIGPSFLFSEIFINKFTIAGQSSASLKNSHDNIFFITARDNSNQFLEADIASADVQGDALKLTGK